MSTYSRNLKFRDFLYSITLPQTHPTNHTHLPPSPQCKSYTQFTQLQNHCCGLSLFECWSNQTAAITCNIGQWRKMLGPNLSNNFVIWGKSFTPQKSLKTIYPGDLQTCKGDWRISLVSNGKLQRVGVYAFNMLFIKQLLTFKLEFWLRSSSLSSKRPSKKEI